MSQNFDDVIRRLNQTPEVMAAELRRAMTASLLLVEADARLNAPHDTRRLAGSITHRIDGEGLVLVGHVGPSVPHEDHEDHEEHGPSVLYGAPVEFGRQAGARMPPVGALIGWVKRHFHPVRARVSDEVIYRQAFALARAIARRGIPARPFMQPAFDKNRAQIDVLFAQVGARVIASIAGRGLT